MIRRKIYQWHRTLSLIIAIPVMLWAVSGFMHPVMTTIRPKVVQQTYLAPVIDSTQLKVSIPEALKTNKISKINTIRIIQINGKHFYQFKLPGNGKLQYISTMDGRLLKNGDELYARYLAKHFLQGNPKSKMPVSVALLKNSESDCCANATKEVMSQNNGVPIRDVAFLEQFDDEYKSINRLLPAYRISFERDDNIRIYVETAQDRFSLAFDNNRAVFDKLFQLFHNLSWLDSLGNIRIVVEIIIMTLAFLTTLMGIYIFFISKSKTTGNKPISRARRNHRYISVVASVFTLLFTFSGAFHAFQKFKPDARTDFFVENTFSSSELNLDWDKLHKAIQDKVAIINVSAVKINDQGYWQVYNRPVGGREVSGVSEVGIPAYINADDYTLLKNGEEIYARYLASSFTNNRTAVASEAKFIAKFAGEYGFVNKRLPVWKLSYATNDNERFYVETSSGKLSVRIDDKEVYEGLSFAFLHKHHFMDFAGKSWRDFSTMFWAAMQIAMIIVGLILWRRVVRTQKRNSPRSN